VLVRRALEDAGLPRPMAQVSIEDRNREQAGVVDFVWPEKRVVLAVHSREFHSTERAHERDFRQHAAMAAVGYLVIPVTTRRFMQDREGVISEVRAALNLD
jgi:very-short-patch-repair endonuclease